MGGPGHLQLSFFTKVQFCYAVFSKEKKEIKRKKGETIFIFFKLP